jgi:hypothetical protein
MQAKTFWMIGKVGWEPKAIESLQSKWQQSPTSWLRRKSED